MEVEGGPCWPGGGLRREASCRRGCLSWTPVSRKSSDTGREGAHGEGANSEVMGSGWG